MITSSNGNSFHITGPLSGESTGHQWIPLTKASDAELWCFLWFAFEQWLSKQSRCWWFETPSCWLWRHCNAGKCKPSEYHTCWYPDSVHRQVIISHDIHVWDGGSLYSILVESCNNMYHISMKKLYKIQIFYLTPFFFKSNIYRKLNSWCFQLTYGFVYWEDYSQERIYPRPWFR